MGDGCHDVDGHLTPGQQESEQPTARDDPADHTAIINAGLATGVARKLRLKPPKLLHHQPELTVAQYKAPFQDFESNDSIRESSFMGADPRSAPTKR
ncbi:hypothetical protein FBZ85_10519 [Azospirillum brasilense]|nr:hypothetical protein FBZ85_10519 [Azospirillum brasilense]